MLFTDTYLQPVQHLLSAISERQRINGANIANAQTPGYRARSVSFAELLGEENPFETPLAAKMGSHMPEMDTRITESPVELQKELIETQKNLLFYNMAVRRASTIVTGLKTASQVGR
jgi:flagellar basal-body rod protein FlgB